MPSSLQSVYPQVSGLSAGRSYTVLLEMRIQLSQLNLVQLHFTADLVHAQQVVETTLLVRALEKIKIRALLVFSAVFSAVTPVT